MIKLNTSYLTLMIDAMLKSRLESTLKDPNSRMFLNNRSIVEILEDGIKRYIDNNKLDVEVDYDSTSAGYFIKVCNKKT